MNPLYTKMGIKYQQAYSGPYHDMSVSIDNSRLICSTKNGYLTGFGRPVISIGDTRLLLKPFKKLYYACNHFVYMDDLIDGNMSDISLFLIKDNIEPRMHLTQIIDLIDTDAELHCNLRKSYKSLVNKYMPTDVSVDYLHQIHRKSAGKETRTQETWDIQQQMVDKEEAFCLGIPNAAALFLVSQDTCYYGVAASDGVDTHSLLWHAILRAKSIGCEWFDMGEQVYNGSAKLKKISKFKRGFGGKTKVRMEFVK